MTRRNACLCLKVRTAVEQALFHLLTLLGMSNESNGHGDALAREETIILAVCDGPYLAEDGRLELCTSEGLDCGVTSDDAELIRVRRGEESIYECQLGLSGRKGGSHGAHWGRCVREV